MSDAIEDSTPRALSDLVKPTLREIVDFGSNPGNLRMRLFVPNGASRPRPLVVVLHGCRQTADGYDLGSGWSRLAEACDFLVLYPEQKHDNNRDNCFSWFEPERGRDEIESIRQMITAAIETRGADPSAVHICGLSAGGAMSGAMLAAYPELFAGGAIIAGLPFGTALNLSEAYESMGGRTKKAKTWGDLVRAASAYDGVWPSVAIWHGTADKVVNPINAGELVKQWTNVHGVGAAIPAEDHLGKVVRRTWRDAEGRVCVAEYSVPGLAHGAPVADTDPPAPFFLPADISSTRQIACDWGLTRRPGAAHVSAGIQTRPADAREKIEAGKQTPTPALAPKRRPRRRFWSIFGL